MALGDTKVGEQMSDGFGRHRAAAVGVDRQLVAFDALLADRVFEEGFGEVGLGAVATSSGFTVAEWVAWRRRSPTSPCSRSTRYIIDTDAR